jgi:hypothetical protein
MLSAAAISGRRFMSPVAKPGDRAAVHGVRTPLPSNFARKQVEEEKGEDLLKQEKKDTGEERQEETKRAAEESISMESTKPSREEAASEVSDPDLSPTGGSTPKSVGHYIHRAEIPLQNPNFQQSRRFSVVGSYTEQDHVHVSGGKQTKVSGGPLEDVEEKVKEEISASPPSSKVPTVSGQSDALEERARESLEQVRSGVPSTQATGVMTNFVSRIAYFQEPEKDPEVEWGTAEEVLERGRREWEEAVASGDGQNPASKLLHERLRQRDVVSS